jgi:hypothetical protein
MSRIPKTEAVTNKHSFVGQPVMRPSPICRLHFLRIDPVQRY